MLKRALMNKQHTSIFNKADSLDLGSFLDLVTFGNTDKIMGIHLVGTAPIPNGIKESSKAVATYGYSIKIDNEGVNEVYLGGHIEDYEFNFTGTKNKGTKASCFTQNNTLVIENPHINGLNPVMRATGQNDIRVENFNRLFQNGEFTQSILKDFHYVPFFRTAMNYGEPLMRQQDDFLQNEPRNIIRNLLSNLGKNPRLLTKVNLAMERMVDKSIRSRLLDLGTEQGATLDFVKGEFANAITNEGTGPNQAVLLLAVLVGTDKNSTISIDEPEIHLHPLAQSRLAKIMIELVKNESKQIIFTTHSEHMIYPFLASIASKTKQSLTPKDVAIYYVSTDEKTNLSKIESLKINEYGQLKGGMKGFWDADMEIFSEFMSDKIE